MSYTTPAKIRGLLVPAGGASPSASDKSTPASFNDETLQQFIEEADALIDATLAVRYAVPFNPTPRLVEAISGAFSAYYATLTYRKTKNLESTDPANLRYRRYTSVLEDLARGTISLPGTDDDMSGDAEALNPYNGDLWDLQDFDTREVPPHRGYL